MADIGRIELNKCIKSLFASGDYSDFVITCGPDTHNVHKAVICPQSKFFKNAEKFPFGKEAAEGVVDLPEEEPKIVKLLIDFFYEGDYEPRLPVDSTGLVAKKREHDNHDYKATFPHSCGLRCLDIHICQHHWCRTSSCGFDCRNFICKECTGVEDPRESRDPADLLLHAKMAVLADKYDIPALATVSHQKLDYACGNFWDHETFPQVFEYVLSHTVSNADGGLRDVLCKTLVAHPELLAKPYIQAVVEEDAGFAYHVVKQQGKELGRLWARAK